MNDWNSEQEFEIVPPPLPAEHNPVYHQITHKMRAQILNLCGQTALVAILINHLKNQFHEFSTLSQGYLDSATIVRIVVEQNKVLICLHGWLYMLPVVLIVKYLRELSQYES